MSAEDLSALRLHPARTDQRRRSPLTPVTEWQIEVQRWRWWWAWRVSKQSNYADLTHIETSTNPLASGGPTVDGQHYCRVRVGWAFTEKGARRRALRVWHRLATRRARRITREATRTIGPPPLLPNPQSNGVCTFLSEPAKPIPATDLIEEHR